MRKRGCSEGDEDHYGYGKDDKGLLSLELMDLIAGLWGKGMEMTDPRLNSAYPAEALYVCSFAKSPYSMLHGRKLNGFIRKRELI